MAQSESGFSTEVNRGEFHRTRIRSTDAFDKVIADGTTNELDLASHYEFDPERHRLFRNGSRVKPHYGSISQFTDEDDVYKLQPDPGDTMHTESAESVTYTVQYVLQMSMAFSINQSLTNGDKLRLGIFDENDGWLIEQRGADHADDEVDIIVIKGGTEETLETNVKLPKPVTGFHRLECKYSWYNIGNQEWLLTYTENGIQHNEVFAKTSKDGERSTNTGNLNIRYEIQADASTTGLEMNVGSSSAVTLGQITNLTRLKQQYEAITLTGSIDTWEPLLAMRIDPNKPNVNAELEQVDVLQYGANDDLELLVVSVDPNETDASGFTVNNYHHSYSSAIQTTESITQVPDSVNGTQQDLDSTQSPGGHTLASSVLLSGGGQSEAAKTAQGATETKKPILDSDEVIFLARSGTVDSDVEFMWETNQNW
jgi:hypothetical protein